MTSELHARLGAALLCHELRNRYYYHSEYALGGRILLKIALYLNDPQTYTAYNKIYGSLIDE